MEKNLVLAILAFLTMAFLMAGGCSREESGDPVAPVQKSAPDGMAAMDFSLNDIAGEPVALGDFDGRPVVIIFTTTWCPHCIKEIPNWKALYERYRQKIGFVAVYVNESQQKVAAFAKVKDLPYPVLLDPRGDVARAYGVRGVPTQVVIDRGGKIFRPASYALAADLAAVAGE